MYTMNIAHKNPQQRKLEKKARITSQLSTFFLSISFLCLSSTFKIKLVYRDLVRKKKQLKE